MVHKYPTSQANIQRPYATSTYEYAWIDWRTYIEEGEISLAYLNSLHVWSGLVEVIEVFDLGPVAGIIEYMPVSLVGHWAHLNS